jgi:hypothetical protein
VENSRDGLSGPDFMATQIRNITPTMSICGQKQKAVGPVILTQIPTEVELKGRKHQQCVALTEKSVARVFGYTAKRGSIPAW